MNAAKGIPKNFIYGIVKIEVIEINDILYKSEVFYGFVSTLPFRPLFDDVNRAMLCIFFLM